MHKIYFFLIFSLALVFCYSLSIASHADECRYGEAQFRFREAVTKNDTKAVQCLIDKGRNINCSRSHGDTALGQAAALGNYETFKLLLKNGAKLNAGEPHPLESTLLFISLPEEEIKKYNKNRGNGTDILKLILTREKELKEFLHEEANYTKIIELVCDKYYYSAIIEDKNTMNNIATAFKKFNKYVNKSAIANIAGISRSPISTSLLSRQCLRKLVN